MEVTGWVWNKMKSTKVMMIAMRRKVSCSMIAVRLRLVGRQENSLRTVC